MLRDLIEGLNIRFKTALESKTEREFYMSLFYYFDYIYKTPKLKKIYDESAKEYNIAFSDIWKERKEYTKEEIKIKRSEVSKLERFNLFSMGCGIECRIYWPIDDYKNSDAPDNKQDPIAVVLLKGLKYALSLEKWDKEELKSINKWFENNREEYEVELRRFHLIFLNELNKEDEIVIAVESKNNNFVFNIETGKFNYFNTEGILSPTSREFKFLKVLYTSPEYQATYEKLLDKEEKANSYDKNMLVETARVLRRKLNISTGKKGGNKNIIKSISKYGYKLSI